ncbi:MAG: hypothetical protein KF745_05805 [Phycisphaeraceae bacterium]|nr:hypothetical protein [Phycisphaeraceae bacterium]
MTTPQGSPPAKICIRCKQDCSSRPRTKDAAGRYTCRDCVEALQANRAAQAAAAPVAAVAESEPWAFDPADDNAAIFGLADAPAAAPSAKPAGGPCKGCGNFIAPGVVVCTNCGFNTKTGKQLGVKTGVDVLEDHSQRAKRQREGAKTAQQEYIKPLVMLIVGVAGVAVLGGQGASSVLAYLVATGIGVVVGLAVYWVCCMLWIGFDAPMGLTALRLAGIYVVVDLVAHLCDLLPIPLLTMILPCLTYMGLLMSMLDMEIVDAVVVAIATFIVKMLLLIVLLSALLQAL